MRNREILVLIPATFGHRSRPAARRRVAHAQFASFMHSGRSVARSHRGFTIDSSAERDAIDGSRDRIYHCRLAAGTASAIMTDEHL